MVHSNVVLNARALKISGLLNSFHTFDQRPHSDLDDPTLEKANQKFSPLHLEEEAILQTLEHNNNVSRGANGEALRHASEVLKSDREFVLKAVQANGMALKYVDPDLQHDSEVVICALKQNGMALEFVPYELQCDEEVACVAIGQTLSALSVLPKEMLTSARVRMKADPSGKWRSSKEFMMAAVQQDGLHLQHAAIRLLQDDEVVLAALQENGMALEFAKYHNHDKLMVGEAVQENGLAIQFASHKLREDPEIIWKALHQNGLALEFLSEARQADLFTVIQALGQNGHALQFASEYLRRDPGLVVRAVLYNLGAWQFAAQELKEDPTILPQSLQEAIRRGDPAVQQTKSVVDQLMKDVRISPTSRLKHISKTGKPHPGMSESVWKWSRPSIRMASKETSEGGSYNKAEDMFRIASTPTTRMAAKSPKWAAQQRAGEAAKRQWIDDKRSPMASGSPASPASIKRGSIRQPSASPVSWDPFASPTGATGSKARPRPTPLEETPTSHTGPPSGMSRALASVLLHTPAMQYPTSNPGHPGDAARPASNLSSAGTATGPRRGSNLSSSASAATGSLPRPKSAEGNASAPWWKRLGGSRPNSAVGSRPARSASLPGKPVR